MDAKIGAMKAWKHPRKIEQIEKTNPEWRDLFEHIYWPIAIPAFAGMTGLQRGSNPFTCAQKPARPAQILFDHNDTRTAAALAQRTCVAIPPHLQLFAYRS
ncbi:hypothetical protein [Porphyrobacter sp. YT40]|uniref:hypothetical protein n=1 Tax=Porphyrobacter sp. YT40 TaxID=2547601 RepID=UPI001141C814|nr:hypothetical protein [Porphyrobacter sp. YT40]QDH33959.1 hypothetical protein E2E27_06190 [Porphyrobacter sp. YT40]